MSTLCCEYCPWPTTILNPSLVKSNVLTHLTKSSLQRVVNEYASFQFTFSPVQRCANDNTRCHLLFIKKHQTQSPAQISYLEKKKQ